MPDEADLGNDQAEKSLAASLKAQLGRAGMVYKGRCYYCETPTPQGHNFCDVDCRDDFERLEWARKMGPV